MRCSIPKLASRRLVTIASAIALSWIIFMLFLPSDHAFRSFLRFNWGRASGYIREIDHSWIWKPKQYDVDFVEDVGLLIKTGYGTRHRVLAQMEALGLRETSNAVIVVGDFGSRIQGDRINVDVHDVVERLLKDHAVAGLLDAPRVLRYKELQQAISIQDEGRAQEIGEKEGWNLDALKFIPGLELAYRRAPSRKWWVVMDDDTLLIKPSLEKVLSHLDPSKDHYLGNAIGDYKGRFAHGGSAVVLSQRTVHHLFEHPNAVADAKRKSLNERFGDKLVATALMKIGVYLDERFTPYFNGEQPLITKVRAENFCLPLVSFHGLGDPDNMRDVGKRFKDATRTFFRGELWELYQQPDMKTFSVQPARPDHDHVGRLDESTLTIENVPSGEECAKRCDTESESCLAWTWVEENKNCHLAPWVIVGDEAKGKSSGVNYQRAQDMGQKCEDAMRAAGCLTEGSECSL